MAHSAVTWRTRDCDGPSDPSQDPPADRIKWSRIVIAAGQACNSILRDVDIEALKQQIQDLKQLTEERLGDEQGIDQEEHPTTPKED